MSPAVGVVESTPSPVAADLAAAVVLVSWEPGVLVSVPGDELGPDAPEALEQLSRPLRNGRRQVMDDVRRRTLAQLGLELARRARAANPEAGGGPAQELFDVLLAGSAPPVSSWAEPWVAVGERVIGWLERVEGLELPYTSALQLLQERLELLRPLRRGADRLRGQQGVLAEIGSWIQGSPPSEPLMVRGLGGSGKSTLMARLFIDHVDAGGRGAYLDFDAAALDLGSVQAAELGLESVVMDPRRAVLLRETARQLAVLIGDASYRYFARDLDTMDGVSTLIRAASEYGRRQGDGAPSQVLLVLDTLEELQYLGPDAVAVVTRFLAKIATSHPEIRVLLSGRAPVPELTAHLVAVPVLEPKVATDLLRDLVRAQGGTLSDAEAGALIGRIGTFPLHVAIAANAVSEEPELIAEVQTRELEGKVAAGFLYRRILRHLHQGEVQPIAERGLALRRLDEEVIRAVLAPVLGPDVTANTSTVLAELAREVALTRPIEGGLSFRQEVREMVLGQIRADYAEEWPNLHRRAAALWASRKSALPPDSPEALEARTEELYHRLVLWEAPEAVEALWDPGSAPGLISAADESILPVEARRFLAERTAHVDGQVAPRLSTLRRVARALGLAQRAFDGGQLDEAAEALRQGEALDDPRGQLLMARIERGQGGTAAFLWVARAAADTTDAVTAHDAVLQEAAWLAADGKTDSAISRLEVCLQAETAPIRRLRLMNQRVKLGGETAVWAKEAEALVEAVGPTILARDPVLLRELIGWVPGDALVIVALRTFGLDEAPVAEREALLGEVLAWEASVGGSGRVLEGVTGRVSSERVGRLLGDLFYRTTDLEMFTKDLDYRIGADINWNGSLNEVIASSLSVLRVRGLLGPPLRDLLRRRFPERDAEILATFTSASTSRSGGDIASSILDVFDHEHLLPASLADRLRRTLRHVALAPSEVDALALALEQALGEARLRAELAVELGLDDEVPASDWTGPTADVLLEGARRAGRVLALARAAARRAPAFWESIASAFLSDLVKRIEAALHIDDAAVRLAVTELREAKNPGVDGAFLDHDHELSLLFQVFVARPALTPREFIAPLLSTTAGLADLTLVLAQLAGLLDPHWGLAECARLRPLASPASAIELREIRRELLAVLSPLPAVTPTARAYRAELEDLAPDPEALHQRIALDPTAAEGLVGQLLASRPRTHEIVILVRRLEAIHGLTLANRPLARLRRELCQRTFELPISELTAADDWLDAALLRASQVVTMGAGRYGLTRPGVVVDAAWFGEPTAPLVLALLPTPPSGAPARTSVATTTWDGQRHPKATAWTAERRIATSLPAEIAGSGMELVLLKPGPVLGQEPPTLGLEIPPRSSRTDGARVRIAPEMEGGPATRLAFGKAGSHFFRGPPAPACSPVFDEDWALAGVHLRSEADGYSVIWTVEELVAFFSP